MKIQIRLQGGAFDGLTAAVPGPPPAEVQVPQSVPAAGKLHRGVQVIHGRVVYHHTGRTDRDGAALYTYAGA